MQIGSSCAGRVRDTSNVEQHPAVPSVEQQIASLRREGSLLADGISRGDPASSAPTCPGWLLRDVVRHIGGVHRWATRNVAEGLTGPVNDDLEDVAGGWPEDSDLDEWFRSGCELLALTLENAPEDLECWSFLPAPSALEFWSRRQAHETAIHRVDVEAASESVTPFPAPFAADGIDEILTGFAARKRSRLCGEPGKFAVHASDEDRFWVLDVDQERVIARRVNADGPADCTVVGPASDLYMWLWNRRGLEGLRVEGDASWTDRWRSSLQVRWS